MMTLSRRGFSAALGAGLLLASSGTSRGEGADRLRIGFQRSSTLTYLLKLAGELERVLAPLNISVSWHEFTSGLPILEVLNLGNLDLSADVADAVPVFAQAAGARMAAARIASAK